MAKILSAADRKNGKAWRLRVGKAVRRAREALDMTQKDLALIIGVGFDTISGIENGRSSPEFATIEALGDALNMSLDELTGRTHHATSPHVAETGAHSTGGRRGVDKAVIGGGLHLVEDVERLQAQIRELLDWKKSFEAPIRKRGGQTS